MIQVKKYRSRSMLAFCRGVVVWISAHAAGYRYRQLRLRPRYRNLKITDDPTFPPFRWWSIHRKSQAKRGNLQTQILNLWSTTLPTQSFIDTGSYLIVHLNNNLNLKLNVRFNWHACYCRWILMYIRPAMIGYWIQSISFGEIARRRASRQLINNLKVIIPRHN